MECKICKFFSIVSTNILNFIDFTITKCVYDPNLLLSQLIAENETVYYFMVDEYFWPLTV